MPTAFSAAALVIGEDRARKYEFLARIVIFVQGIRPSAGVIATALRADLSDSFCDLPRNQRGSSHLLAGFLARVAVAAWRSCMPGLGRHDSIPQKCPLVVLRELEEAAQILLGLAAHILHRLFSLRPVGGDLRIPPLGNQDSCPDQSGVLTLEVVGDIFASKEKVYRPGSVDLYPVCEHEINIVAR